MAVCSFSLHWYVTTECTGFPEPDWEEAWKPPKLPEAVTVKPEGEVLKSTDRDARPEIEQAAAQIDSILQAYWKEMAPKRLLGPMTMNLYEGRT